MFGFLLVGSSLGDAGFTQVGFRHSGLHRLRGSAVLETLGHVIVLDSDHILDRLEGGFCRFLDLGTEKTFHSLAYCSMSLILLSEILSVPQGEITSERGGWGKRDGPMGAQMTLINHWYP